MRHAIYKYLCLSFLLSSAISYAQTPSKVEYFWDKDPGHGKGYIVTASAGENNLRINFNNVDYGVHTLWIRTQDSNGNWSSTIGKPILVKKDAATTITKLEYFWDKDLGYDKASPIKNINVGDNFPQIDFSDICDGAHLLCLRAKDNIGVWSIVITKPIYVYTINPRVLDMEYFIDSDPGEGNGIKVDISGDNQENATFSINTDTLTIGAHQLNVRIKDCYGLWSILSSEPFEITEADGVERIEFTMPISISASDGTCVLQSNRLSSGDYHITIVSIDGRTLASTSWNSDSNICEISIGVRNQPIFVVVENDNNRLVKRIMSK